MNVDNPGCRASQFLEPLKTAFWICAVTVPKTDTGALVEKTKACGVSHLREFGKLALYLRKKGCLPFKRQVAVTRGARLFNKNVVGRYLERVCMADESWPLPVC